MQAAEDRMEQGVVLPAEEAQAASPFLAGTFTQWAWDSTSLGYLKTCPRLYQYKMIEGWEPRNENIHLRWGIEYHQALQDYDLSRAAGISHDDSLHDVIRELLIRIHSWDPEPDFERRSEMLKTKEALVRTVVWYIDHFKDDPAETYIREDGKPAVEQSFQFELDFGPKSVPQPYVLCGHLDRIVRFSGDLFVCDRKTTTTTPGSHYFEQYEVNNQMSLYTIAGRIVIQSPIRGVIIDVAQVGSDKDFGGYSRFTRGFTYRTPDQINEWLADLRFWLIMAESFSVAGYWPMNDTSCDKFGGCKFRSVCARSPQVREAFLKAEFVRREPWNPLKTR